MVWQVYLNVLHISFYMNSNFSVSTIVQRYTQIAVGGHSICGQYSSVESVSEEWILLDSQSMVHVFCNRKLLHKIRRFKIPCRIS